MPPSAVTRGIAAAQAVASCTIESSVERVLDLGIMVLVACGDLAREGRPLDGVRGISENLLPAWNSLSVTG